MDLADGVGSAARLAATPLDPAHMVEGREDGEEVANRTRREQEQEEEEKARQKKAATEGEPEISGRQRPKQVRKLSNNRTLPSAIGKSSSEMMETSESMEFSGELGRQQQLSRGLSDPSLLNEAELSSSFLVPTVGPEVDIVRSSVEITRESKLASVLSSMNRLDFDSVGLVGRDQEVAILRRHFEEMATACSGGSSSSIPRRHRSYSTTVADDDCAAPKRTKGAEKKEESSKSTEAGAAATPTRIRRPPKRQFVFISGHSGTGKTALAMSLKQTVRRKGGAFVSGRYKILDDHPQASPEPLVGIGKACNELCRTILYKRPKPLRMAILKDLQDHIDKPLLEILENVIPLLSFVLSSSPSSTPPGGSGRIYSTCTKPRRTLSGASCSSNISGCSEASSNDSTRRREQRDVKNAQNINSIRRLIRNASRIRRVDDSSGSLSSSTTSERKQRSIDNLSQSKRLVEFSIRTFLKIFANKLGPLVIMMDDLQWADSSSLEILHALAKDPTISNLMIIGCYRSENMQQLPPQQVNADDSLAKTVQNLKAGARQDDDDNNKEFFKSGDPNSDYATTEISTSNLSLQALNDFMTQLLDVSSPDKALGLSNICFKRTLGNVFFVKIFLMMLQEMEYLTFQVETFQWTWDETIVEKETAATENVVNLIKTKISKSPDGMILLLQIAACLGSTFDISTIALVWSHWSDNIDQSDTTTNRRSTQQNSVVGDTKTVTTATTKEPVISSLLDAAEQEMFLEPVGVRSYRFVHDKIQETAMALIPADSLNDFHGAVGKCLYEYLGDEELESNLFTVTNLLNQQQRHSAGDGRYIGGTNTDVAELNARAAEKARELSAFATAIHYVECGLQSIRGIHNMWEECPALAVDLHSIGAEAEECAGNSDKSDWYCNQIRQQENISILDKMRTNNIFVERLYSNGKYDELWTVCLDVLDRLGCRFPRKRSVQKFTSQLYLKSTKKSYLPVNHDVDDMPIIEDQVKREAVAFMIKAASFGLGSNNRPLYILLCCRCVRWTLKFGVTRYTASALVSFANVMMHEMGDWNTALKIGEIALKIENRIGSNYTKTSTLHKLSSFVLGWVKPLRSCRNNYLEAYKVGMLSGNIEGVGMAILFFLMCDFFSGGNTLHGLDEDLRNYIPQLEKLNLHTYVLGLRLLWQKVMNLIDTYPTTSTTTLTGQAMSGIDIEKHPFIYNTAGRHHICNLCAYFAEYEKGAQLALDMGDCFYKMWAGAAYFGFEPFSRALCLYAMAIQTKQSKYVKAARKVRSSMSTWVKAGAINLVHQLFILDAEDSVLKGSPARQVEKLYNKAITASVKTGFLQDAGIANERFASYYLVSLQRTSDASYFVKEAIRHYSQWGAMRKVEMLREQYHDLLNDATTGSRASE